MMPHPNVAPSVEGIILQQKKTWYNEEAARGVTNWKYQDTNVNIFYGIGGCLALPAQNGWDVYHEVIFQSKFFFKSLLSEDKTKNWKNIKTG